MTKVKVFEIFGDVINRGGVRVKTLPQQVEKQLGAFLATIPPERVVKVLQTVDAGGAASGGAAFFTVIYDDPKAKASKEQPAGAEGGEEQVGEQGEENGAGEEAGDESGSEGAGPKKKSGKGRK